MRTKSQMMKLAMGFVLAGGIWCANPAMGVATHYVAPTGSDANGGTDWADAWATIGHAAAQAATNSTILVSNGVYAITAEITLDKAVTVRGVGGDPGAVVIDGGGSTTTICFYLSDPDARVESLTATNAMRGFHLYYGGTVSNCVSTGHRSARQSNGAFLYHGGLVTHSRIANNRGYDNGGGASIYYGGTLRNCLIVDNETTRTPAFGGGGGVLCRGTGNTVENCTITRNKAPCGGGTFGDGLSLHNSIVRGNRAPTSPDIEGNPTINNSCVSDLPATGSGNTNANPRFVSPETGDFRLQPGSPAINSGAYQDWMAAAVDLDGVARTNGVVDMGCYEYTPGALDCGFDVTPTTAFPDTSIVLTAAVAGTNTSSVTYAWDLDGDGNDDHTGSEFATVTNSYAACGRYAVRLRVTNGVGESRSLTRADAIVIGPPVAHVAQAGNTSVYPYDTWATAASNVQDAVDAAVSGSTVWVENGHYILDEMITLNQAVALRSVEGPGGAVLDGNASVPCLYLDHADAIVDGFTITNGYSTTTTFAAGVHLYSGGMVSNCTIIGNTSTPTSGSGGFSIEGVNGMLSHCRVLLNAAAGYGIGGGRVVLGLVRNCLVVGNEAAAGGGSCGGIAIPSGGTIESCTITGNRVASSGGTGGIMLNYGAANVYNCIVTSNDKGDAVVNWSNTAATLTAANNCTTPTFGSDYVTDDPGFRDPGTGSGPTITFGDYRLADDSPCRDAGLSSRPWLDGSVDLAGGERLVGGAVDIGAFEWQPPPGTTFLIR